MLIPEHDQLEYFIATFRYYLGRQTIGVHTMIKAINDNWWLLRKEDRGLIKREIMEADKLDGLGDRNIDRPVWLKVLELL